MAKNDILTVQEINAFMDRVRATVAAAQATESMKEALAVLVRGTVGRISAPTETGARGRRAAAQPGGARAKGRGRGRQARVSNQAILDMLRKAGAGGLGMRDLEAELKQHPETIRLKLRNLRNEGLVRTTGPRNQLRYHAAGGGESTGAEAKSAAKSAGAAGKGRRGRKAGGGRAAKSAGRGRKRGSASTAPDGFNDQILGLIRTAGTDGVQMNALASGLKADPKMIRRALETLRTSGAIRVSGQRRSTRYHAAA